MGALIYRESWKEIPPARPVTQEHVSHPELILSLHGPGRMGLKKSHHAEIAGDPYYIWSGKCEGIWALSLRHNRFFINFEDAGMVRGRANQSGGHRLRLIVKPVDGPWLVSDQFAGGSEHWREFEFRPLSLSWRLLDIDEVKVMGKAPAVSLTKIDAVGFTDLSAGAGSEACSRLAWIEVWGGEVLRPAGGE
jgi:hypothetical protein